MIPIKWLMAVDNRMSTKLLVGFEGEVTGKSLIVKEFHSTCSSIGVRCGQFASEIGSW
jgi:hypothetical protein